MFAQRFEDECGEVKVAFKLPDGKKLEHWCSLLALEQSF